MEKIKILIIEREPIAAQDLADDLDDLGYQVTDTVYSLDMALKVLAQRPPDLLLLASTLAHNADGMEIAQIIRQQYDIPYIYLIAPTDQTVFAQIRTTETLAGYLLKPIRPRDLQNNIEISLYNYAQKFSIIENSLSSELDKNDFWLKDYFYLKVNGQMHKIKSEDILWAESYDHHTCIQTTKEKFVLSKTLKTIEEKLAGKGFVRVHRSYLINPNKITTIENGYVFFQKFKVPISNEFRAELNKFSANA
ncbi:MAG: response regulator transcription factor [Microscillaceae bacterium]|jgi:DNA-binding LytR/AlgR family response regulator|nr:response regulator transcription factor [Microscillaceae bacterium]